MRSRRRISCSSHVLKRTTDVFADTNPPKGSARSGKASSSRRSYSKAPQKNKKFIPILFWADEATFIPEILRASTYYRVDLNEGYDDLYRRLTSQPKTIRPPLGIRRTPATLMQICLPAFSSRFSSVRDATSCSSYWWWIGREC